MSDLRSRNDYECMLYCTVLYVQSHHIGESYFDSAVSTARLPPYPDNYGYCWTRQSQCSFGHMSQPLLPLPPLNCPPM